MSRFRFRTLYFVLLPTIAIAAGVLAYYTWLSASQFIRLGEQTIGQSTLLLIEEKVDVIERFIIQADNAVFERIDFDEPEALDIQWRPFAADLSPSITAVLVLDAEGEIIAASTRGSAGDRSTLLRRFRQQMRSDLALEALGTGRLKHLHKSYSSQNYLIAYQAFRHRGQRFYGVAVHDTDYIVRVEFDSLFATEEGRRQYNVVDSNNRRIYGPSLTQAGDYLFGHRFPTTLYEWRLQVAPKQAPLLERQTRNRHISMIVLVSSSLGIILLGVLFLIYAADKERRLNALKSEFIANVSHELKTPLSVIRMFSEMLLTKRVVSQAKEEQYLEIICGESERLSTLIENVLDFSALERGKQKYEMADGSVTEAIQRAIEAFRYRVERDGIEVNLQTPEQPLPEVKLDEQALVLATMNLLDNAVKYGDGTPIDVSVWQREDHIVVRVRDRGPGIPKEDLRRVFERFYRSKSRRNVRGSGIGLSLVSHIASAHGGYAWAENIESGGAMVAFAIPIPESAGAKGDAPEPPTGLAAE